MPPLPPLADALVLGFIGLCWALVWGVIAGTLKLRRGVRTGFTRKIFHFSIFTGAALIHTWQGFPGVNAYAIGAVSVILLGVWRGDGHVIFEGMARERDAPHRAFFVIVPLMTTALGGLTSNWFFAECALVGYLVTGFGDAIGEPVGVAWGRHPYKVPTLRGKPSTRTLEGSAAVALACTLAAVLGLCALGVPMSEALWKGAFIGLVCMGIETISPHGSDNFTTMVGAAGLAAWLTG